MILQKLLFPREETCKNAEMYFHIKNGKPSVQDKVLMNSGDILEGDSYFNSFSLAKWKKYTVLENLGVVISVKGNCDIYLCGVYINDKNVICRRKDNIVALKVQTSEKKDFRLKFNLADYSMCPVVYVQIKANAATEFYGGYYFTDIDEGKLPNIKLALGICTYHREDFIFRNLNMIDKEIFRSDSVIKNKLDVIVCDNACTLPVKAISNSHVTVYKNKNYGGSGGFTRCIMEALKAKGSKGYSHVILMDDDVAFDCAVLERTYSFLKMLKKERANIAIGGGMLVLTDRIRQFENGARLTGDGMLQFKNKNLNLSTVRNVLVNDGQTGNNYNAWCYCCMPLNKIARDNLPLPLFIHMDDVEYGVRNKFEFVNINGICVWHPFVSNMRNTSIVYYDIRNKLIAMASLGGCDLKEYAKKWLHIFRSDIFVYNYERTMVACKAIRDFLKGIDEFKKVNPIELNKSLAVYNKTWQKASLSHLRHITEPKKINDVKKIRRRKLCNYMFPATMRYVVRTCDISAADPYRAKKLYIVNKADKTEREYKKSLFKAIKCWRECKKVEKLIDKKMDIVGLEWRVRAKELYAWSFWTEYLGI